MDVQWGTLDDEGERFRGKDAGVWNRHLSLLGARDVANTLKGEQVETECLGSCLQQVEMYSSEDVDEDQLTEE